uniref:Uncharacterized protein n=1 Tax=Anguilla anguilla TaxID=7936 RepID=A0A0E9SVA6_ANGAN
MTVAGRKLVHLGNLGSCENLKFLVNQE